MDRVRGRAHAGKRGFRRWLRYQYLKLVRLNDTPEKIAGGLALGVMLGTLPTFGLGIIIAIFISGMLRVNRASAIIGTLVVNPWTATFVWALSYLTGSVILGVSLGESIDIIARLETHTDLWQNLLAQKLLLPYMVGNALVTVASGATFYVAGLYSVRAYKAAKKKRLLKKAERLKSRRNARPGSRGGP